jgi:hypothetical protein
VVPVVAVAAVWQATRREPLVKEMPVAQVQPQPTFGSVVVVVVPAPRRLPEMPALGLAVSVVRVPQFHGFQPRFEPL